ncbi:MAG: hypothetical protein ABJZ55_25470 [Fuerstiella sp.]
MAEPKRFLAEDSPAVSQSLSSPTTRIPRKRKAIFGIAIAMLLLFAVIWWLPRPNTMNEPVEYERNADGSFSATPSDAEAERSAVSIRAGKLNARNSISTSSSRSSVANAWFASDHLMVMHHSDHLLLQQTSDELVQQLKDSGLFQSVRYFPKGHLPEPGTKKPDLYLLLNLDSVEETGLATSELQATMIASLGLAPVRNNHHYHDHQSLPIVEVQAELQVDHQSTFSGIESSAAKFEVQGNNIATALSKDMIERIEKLRKQHPRPARLPDSMNPPWEKAEDFAFWDQFEAKQLLSVHGTLLKNETFWSVAANVSQTDFLKAVYEELKAEQWNGEAPKDDAEYLRMTSDGKVLTVFKPRKNSTVYRVDNSNTPPSDASPDNRSLWVHYQSLLTRQERLDAYADLLSARPVNVDTLFILKQMGSSVQRNQMLALLKENPPSTVSAWVALANHSASKDQMPEAVHAIQCAHLLHELRQDDDAGIKKFVKKHKLERSKTLVMTEAAVAALKIVNVDELTGPVERNIGPEQMVAAAAKHEDGTWRMFSMRFGSENPANDSAVEYTVSRIADYGASWSSSLWHETADSERVEKLGNTKFRLKTIQETGTRCPNKVIFLPLNDSDEKQSATSTEG